MSQRWLFAFFLVSGFCSLVCEIAWLRLAMAQYGVTTALASIVLSIFMGGLALGSWAAGRLTERLDGRPAQLLRLYAVAETAIALSATVVPSVFTWGRGVLLSTSGAGWNSGTYHAASALIIAGALLPFCGCMGATFPLGVAILKTTSGGKPAFSYLYLANVVGATAGTLVSSFVMIELLGFSGTLAFVAGMNAVLGASALGLSLSPALGEARREAAGNLPRAGPGGGMLVLLALLTTGLVSMGMEIVWVRQLTPYLGTVVYSFAIILGLYLAATFLGSAAYRRWAAGKSDRLDLGPTFWVGLGLAALLPLLAADPRVGFPASMAGGAARAALAIVPFCGGLGFLTPLLTDRWSGGNSRRVGTAYALNVLGCILGPLVASFVLLPVLGERGALLVLAAPLVLAGGLRWAGTAGSEQRRQGAWVLAGIACAALLLGWTRGPEDRYPDTIVRRDSTATVTVFGRGMERSIAVNGVGMTILTPITKMMAHLPLAFHETPPRSALIICFGMGTSFRSALSWGISATAVELVPSIPPLFGLFHSDAEELMRSPLARVVVDDGRRYLERSTDQYDVIIVDPPPPVEAAASSLLYSREFYQAAGKRLAPGGVLQQWLPGTRGDAEVLSALVKALRVSFAHVRMFESVEGWGLHMLASAQPLSAANAEALLTRLPPRAVKDLMEWGPKLTARDQLASVLDQEVSAEALANLTPAAPLSDDRPINEYFLLRQIQRHP